MKKKNEFHEYLNCSVDISLNELLRLIRMSA